MEKNSRLSFLRLLGALISLLLPQGGFAAASLPPTPPAENPHPPLTQIDVQRVRFAEQAVQELLMKSLPPTLKISGVENPPPFQDKDLACLKNPNCYSKDAAFVDELLHLQERSGIVEEIRHAHLIPWSMKRMNMRSQAPDSSSTTQPLQKMAAPAFETSMPGPNLKPDEFIVHIYAKFKKSPAWFHLDVILYEDAQGRLFLRHFYALPMATPPNQLPPGAVC